MKSSKHLPILNCVTYTRTLYIITVIIFLLRFVIPKYDTKRCALCGYYYDTQLMLWKRYKRNGKHTKKIMSILWDIKQELLRQIIRF